MLLKGLCGCAERFASDSDLTNDTSAPYFNNDKNGETIIFSSARFHCTDTLTRVNYNGQLIPCKTNCTDNSEGSPTPMIQLWRPNSQNISYNNPFLEKDKTVYDMQESEPLDSDSTSIELSWSVEPGDIIGLWVPPSCSCKGSILRVGYTYDNSRVYRIEGDVESFNTAEYTLENGPQPMITVVTGKNIQMCTYIVYTCTLYTL